MIFRPQAGFQEKAMSTSADIAIIGGAAGCGKTFISLMEFARFANVPNWGGVIFRRTSPQITNEGGLWDTSLRIYPYMRAEPIESKLTWKFRSGCKLKFNHLEYDKDVLNHQGAQYGFIGFDELTHFSEYQFWYMVSRNRSEAGPIPYIRATCNPDPDSWVAKFIEWWIDQETGFPIEERSGVLRYLLRDGDNYVWGDSYDDVISQAPHIFENAALKGTDVDIREMVKTVTFIYGNIKENKIFLKNDPKYLGNLLAQPEEERLRLLDGNWKIRTDGLSIVDYRAAESIFTNTHVGDYALNTRYITCDAARFGRDLCVILVWRGWTVVYTVIFKKSDTEDVIKKIEELRRKFGVMKHNVMIDSDGVGLGASKLGRYTQFHGGDTAVDDPDTADKEDYKNLKTQCWYRFLELRVNQGAVWFPLTRETCEIYDDSSITRILSLELKVGGQLTNVRKLLLEDLRSAKRKDPDAERKKQMITKEEQKIILKRSPDIGDCFVMREAFELLGKPKKVKRKN